jgi:hypothetical protein
VPIGVMSNPYSRSIGTLPYVRTPTEVMRRRLFLGAFLVLMVVGLPTLVFLLDRYYLPLDAIVAKINRKLGI